MCHPVYPGLPPQLPTKPPFLPHPWPPHLPTTQWIPTQHPGSHPPAPAIHLQTAPTNGSSTFPKPPSPRNNYPYYKKDPILPSSPNTPIEAYITATEQSILQVTSPGNGCVQIRSQQNPQTTATTTQQPLQPQPSPCRALT